MIGFIVLALTYPLGPSGNLLQMISPKESPFQKIDIAPPNDVLDCDLAAKPGFFLIQEPRFSETIYDQVIRDFNHAEVLIVRKESANSYLAWGINGRIVSLQPDDLPEYVQEGLNVQDLAVATRQYFDDAHPPANQIHFMNVCTTFSSSRRMDWRILGAPKYPFINMMFKMESDLPFDTMRPIEGDVNLSGVSFRLSKKTSTDDEMPGGAMRIKDLTKVRDFTYGFALDFVSTHRKDSASGRHFQSLGPIENTRYEREYSLSADEPIEMWLQILVNRKCTLTGFVRHVPTTPNIIP